MLTMTDRAITKAKEIAENEGLNHCTIRARCLAGGCAGFNFDLEFSEIVNELDEVFEQDEVKLVVDPLSFQYLDEMVIDYLDSPFGGGFKFSGGAIKSTCACGNSFSV